jgi:hypothetical protein
MGQIFRDLCQLDLTEPVPIYESGQVTKIYVNQKTFRSSNLHDFPIFFFTN